MGKRKLSESKRELLQEAEDICNEENRSTEYMIQFMQDFSGCSHDEVIEFLIEDAEEVISRTN